MSASRRHFLQSSLGLFLPRGIGLLDGAFVGNPAKEGPIVDVITSYPFMPAASIEKTITTRIERWVKQAPGVMRITSRSLAGVSMVRVFCGKKVNSDAALKQIGALALGTLPTLPADTLPPVTLLHDPHVTRPLGMLVVHGSAREDALKYAAEIEVRNRLRAHKEWAVPVLLGGKERVVNILLDRKKLASHNLTLNDVVTSLKKANVRSKEWYRDEEKLQLLWFGTILHLREFAQLPIRGKGDKTVPLRDLGRVMEENLPQTVSFRLDGRAAVATPIYPSYGANLKRIAEKVAELVPTLQKRMPRDMQLRWVPFGVDGKKPSSDDGLLVIHLRAPSNCALTDTEKRVAAVERLMEKSIPAKERLAILAEVGLKPDYQAIYSANAGPMDATLFVQLSDNRQRSAADYAAVLQGSLNADPQFADLRFRFASRDMPASVDVRIIGGKPEEQLRFAVNVRRRLAVIKGAVDVDIAQRMDAPGLVITADRKKAEEISLTAKEVLRQIFSALHPQSSPEKNLWIETKGDADSLTIPLPVDFARWQQIGEKPAAGAKQPVKLASLATVRRIIGPVDIDHIDGVRVFDVRANIENRRRRNVIADVRKLIQELRVPDGMRVEIAE